MTEPAIRLQRLSKNFGDVRVLREIDLDIPEGRCLGLAGVNGAGKTTLIRCLLDFCLPDAGTINIYGIDHHQPRARSRLVYLPERFIPPHFLTGGEFVRMMLKMFGVAFDAHRTNAMLEAIDLDTAALDRPVREYSKGMTQKLGLAACLLSERDLYILDEPMSGLDPKARAHARDLLLTLRKQGHTLLLTSHSLADIEEICDHMAVLHRGRLAYAGPPRGLCERTGESSLQRAFLNCIETMEHHA